MSTLNHLLDVIPFVVLGIICTAAILCNSFNDNLLQRIGLAGTALGSLLHILTTIYHQTTAPACDWIGYGVAIYALGTLRKFRKHQRHG